MWCVYFLACVLRPICVPVPETAVILWGTGQIGSLGFFKIPLPQFLKIGIIAKVISIGMIAFSSFLGDLCGLRRWQMIAVELLFMFLASAVLQHFEAIMKEFILIVDDDKDIRRLLGIYLGNEGYRYLACENAAQALDILKHYQVDLILMDVMMPEIDGISACLRIRERSKMPIIFMSAKTEDIDIIQGLTVGGDDYVTKPFKPIELLARVRAQLRRYKQYNETEKLTHTLQTEDLTVDMESRQVWVSGREVKLTRKEYDILEYMLRNKGQVLTMAQIYEAVWHEEFFCSENAVMMHIANLRNKLNWDNVHSDFIKTCWGRGYQI